MKYLVILILISTNISWAQLTVNQFNSDIAQLEYLIKEKHASPFWKISKEEFESIVENAQENILKSTSNDYKRYVEIFEIIASIKDGHSGISAGSRNKIFGYLPFSVRWFGDEIRVTRTAEKFSNILGSKIIEIDGQSIVNVLDKLRTVVPHANESRFKKFSSRYLRLPGLLFGLGITKNPTKALFTFLKNNEQFNSELVDMPPEEEKTNFIDYLETIDSLALHQRDNNLHYWFNYDNKTNIFYFQYNRIGNMESERSSPFARRMWAFVDSVKVDKFILDLRYNGGGNFPFCLPFVQGIVDRPSINKRGKLFIITGYDTFSAAKQMLNLLEARSEAIIIGETPGGLPSGPGDPESYKLDNTTIKVLLSSLWHPNVLLNDKRTVFNLDKTINPSWEDFVKGNDTSIEYIKSYDEDLPVIANANKFKSSIGRYEYSLTKHILLKNKDDELYLDISHSLTTPLYLTNGNTLNTEMVGLSVQILNDQLKLYLPDGSNQICKKIDDSELSAIDYIYENNFEKAEKIYLDIKSRNPEYIELKDHLISFMANIIYFDLIKYAEIDAKEIANKILNLGIKLNDGNAPFCEFAKRFYK